MLSLGLGLEPRLILADVDDVTSRLWLDQYPLQTPTAQLY